MGRRSIKPQVIRDVPEPSFSKQRKKIEWVNNNKQIPAVFINIEELGDELIEFMKDETHHYLKEFAIEKGIHSSMFSILAKKSPYFANCLERAKEMQEVRLCKEAEKARNPAWQIFALKNVADWRDVREVKNELVISNLADLIRRARKQAGAKGNSRDLSLKRSREVLPPHIIQVEPKIKEAEVVSAE